MHIACTHTVAIVKLLYHLLFALTQKVAETYWWVLFSYGTKTFRAEIYIDAHGIVKKQEVGRPTDPYYRIPRVTLVSEGLCQSVE